MARQTYRSSDLLLNAIETVVSPSLKQQTEAIINIGYQKK